MHRGCVCQPLWRFFLNCQLALADDPSYVKALTRRATSNESLNTWASLTEAQKGKCAHLRNVFYSHDSTRLSAAESSAFTLGPIGPSSGECVANASIARPSRPEARDGRDAFQTEGSRKLFLRWAVYLTSSSKKLIIHSLKATLGCRQTTLK